MTEASPPWTNELLELPAEHSPVGGSGMHRWSACPGSVGLSRGVQEEASEYAMEGTDAHTIAAWCLTQQLDAWQCVGEYSMPDGELINVSKDMADAVQVYLNFVRAFPDRNQGNTWIEEPFHAQEIHRQMFGRSDFVYYDAQDRALHVVDYKHGAGIVVDVKENMQLMYYGVGMLEQLQLWGQVDTVTLYIVQPRGFHFDGPIRSWAIDVRDLDNWAANTLKPALREATRDVLESSLELHSGEQCRFCPVRFRACPQLIADMNEMEELMAIAQTAKGGAKALTNKQLGRFLQLFDLAKIVAKAANATAFTRLQDGKKVPGLKLANSRTNRTWKDDAEEAMKEQFGKKAYDTVLLTPAKIDALPEGIAFTARYAYKPEGKLTVVTASDARVAVEKQDNKALFEKKGKK